MTAVFSIYFEDPFWVGVLESRDGRKLSVARHVFGAEPSNAELLDFMLYQFSQIPRAQQCAGSSRREDSAQAGVAGRAVPNPKRLQRLALREAARPVSTKAQAALSAARSELKAEKAAFSREARSAEAERRFALRSEKRKRKRAGR